ncbi:MAG: hypothetical protein CME36_06810 [unclassified Hahellaceae]|nr:hypothetical protein [Hahellaceae bacterium]
MRASSVSFSFWCVTAFVLVLFSDFIPLPFDSYAAKRFFLVLTLVLVVLVPLWSISAGRLQSRGWLLADLSLLVVIWSALLYHSYGLTSSSYGLSEAAMYGAFFSSFVLMGHALFQSNFYERAWTIFLLVSVGACFLYAMMTLTVYGFAIADGQTNLVPFIPWGFVSMRYWSHVATWMLPLFPVALLIGPFKASALWKVMVLLTMAIWWWVIFLSSARGSTIGIAVGLGLVLLLFGRSSLGWAKELIKGFAGGVILWALLSVAVPELLFGETQVRGLKTDNSDRIPQILEAWAMSLQHFPLGMGAQSWLTHDILTSQYDLTKKFGHPHNMYLMWAAEYGWLLVALVLVLVAFAAVRVFVKRRQLLNNDDSVSVSRLVAITASVSAALFHAGVSAVFMAPASMLVGLIVLTLFWCEIQLNSPSYDVPADNTKRKRSFAGGLLLAGFVVIAYHWFGNVSDYHKAMREDVQFYEENAFKGHLPRFWFHGYFPRNSTEMPGTR